METFLPVETTEVKDTYRRDQQDSLCLRVIRKKYKCLIMLLLATISVFQSFSLVLTNVDKNLLSSISDSLSSLINPNVSLTETTKL